MKYGRLLLGALGLCALLFFAGCGARGVPVDTTLTIDRAFSGTRVMEFTPGASDAEAQALESAIAEKCPDGLLFEKTEAGAYRFTLQFDSLEDYCEKLRVLLGREPQVAYVSPDTVFARGTFLEEDFTAADLFAWLFEDTQEPENMPRLRLRAGKTGVTLDGVRQETPAAIVLNTLRGQTVDAIQVHTVNNGDGSYDRTISFFLPYRTLNRMGGDAGSYFHARLGALGTGEWIDYAGGREFCAQYRGATLQQLTEATARLLGSELGDAAYAVDEANSTPFLESAVFEETLLSPAYVGKDGRRVRVAYTYESKEGRTLQGAQVYDHGAWPRAAGVSDGAVQIQGRGGVGRLRLTDILLYRPLRTEIALSCEGGGRFTREVSFWFAKEDAEGVRYAAAYLKKRSDGVLLTVEDGEEGVSCHVTVSGTAQEITLQMEALFGEGNALAYTSEGKFADVHNTTRMTDTLRMEHLYRGGNEGSPIQYIIRTNGKERLESISYAGEHRAGRAYPDEEGTASFPLDGGDATVEYNGNTPNLSGILLAFVLCAAGLAAVAALVIWVKRRGDHSGGGKTPPPPAASAAGESIEDLLAGI
jgi:hypothetical protein